MVAFSADGLTINQSKAINGENYMVVNDRAD
jgi:hypothetical protein